MEDKKFFIGVKALFSNAKGELLIVRKVPTRTDKWKPFWEIPGGKIKGDDELAETLSREIKEEIGVSKFKVKGMHALTKANFKIDSDPDKPGLFLVVYKCELPKGAKIKLSDEHDLYKWVTPAEARKLLAYMFPKSFTDSL